MTDELLERVRAVDPLPDGSTAPPFASVFAQRVDTPRQRDRRRRSRLLGLLLPAVGVTASIGVLVAAVVLLHAKPQIRDRSHVASGNPATLTTPTRVPAIPASGMSGIVTVWGAGFNASGAGVISLEQCLGCQANGNQTAKSTDHDWLVTTTDGGQSWTLSSKNYSLNQPLLVGGDGWAGGLQLLTRQQAGHLAAYEPGVAAPRYFTTRDGGRSWTVAPSSAPNGPGSGTSLVAGEVWASSSDLAVTIVHSPVTGARLTATESQPIHNDDSNVHVVGAGIGTAYVLNGDVPRQAFVTHDDGRSWQQLAMPPCTGKYAFARLDAAFGQTVYLTCSGGNDRTPRLVRSLNGGRSWQQLSVDWGQDGPRQLTAVNANAAWALNSEGDLLRTTDAGTTWQTVWSASNTQVSPLSRPITKLTPSPLPILSANSQASASIVTLLNRGTTAHEAEVTNLVTYRTADGGRTWRTYVVPLTNRPGSHP